MNLLRNHKIEDAVIGTLLMLFEVREILMPKLTVESFDKPDNRAVFDAIHHLYENDREIDPLSVGSWLQENKGWSDAETANLQSYEPIYNDPEDKVNDLNDKRNKRILFSNMQEIIRDMQTKPGTATEFISRIEEALHEQVESIEIPGLSMDQIKERDENQPKFEQMYTGDKFFDHTFYKNVGSRKGQFEVILGRPKHGKTHEAIRRSKLYSEYGYKGLYCTFESNDREIYGRFKLYFDGHNENIKIADKSGVASLEQLIQTVKYWKAVWGLDYCVADYLQRIPVQGINYHDELKRIVTCSNYLSDLAIKEDIFVLALAQPSNPDRSTRKGYKMEPEVWDIYGSGVIEKDAFMVSSIFRPSEIEELRFYDQDGNIRGVKAPGSDNEADMLHRNTVFLRQKIVRDGERYAPYVRLIHTNQGLQRHIPETPF